MSRTFGDEIGHSCGIICTPVVMEFELDSHTPFFVIGSDGLWEMLSEEVIGNVCLAHMETRDSQTAARELAQKARASWLKVDSV